MKALKNKTLLVLSAVGLLSLAACGNKPEPEPTPQPLPAGTDTGVIADDVEEREDYTSLYDEYGEDVSIADVEEDAKGLAYITVGGKKRELGLDFLTMAMVYNVEVPEGSTKYHTRDDVYNEWWKLYIQRWNQMMPEVPLYSNIIFDIYNPKLGNFQTAPYWQAADAINVATSTDGRVILGSSTDLGGHFRNASWGVSSPAASDNDIVSLTTGYSTVMSDRTGTLRWNLWDETNQWGVLEETPSLEEFNADGSLTVTLKIHEGLKFSDNTPITAKNYIVGLLANSTKVGEAAGGSGKSGLQLVGYEAFHNASSADQAFTGVKLLDDYTFSVTYKAQYANYYYNMSYAGFSPDPLALYLGSATDAIQTNANKEVYLNSTFFNKSNDKYTVADEIKANMDDINTLPYSGPFKVKTWSKAALTATLERNPVYPGDPFRGKAPAEHPINELAYIKIEEETQMSKFQAGEVDILAGIMGAEECAEAMAVVEAGDAEEAHYNRAGYGKMGIRCDFGPTMFASVRRAITYSINRVEFADTFTGGYGTVVHGPYYEDFGAYQAVKDEIKLNSYITSAASARRELEADGWIYDKDGNPYNGQGIRYRKLSGHEKTAANLQFKTTDNAYKTVFVNGNWLMPLAVNWIGSQPNPVTDLLKTSWKEKASATTEIGLYISASETDFMTMLGEFYQYEPYGYDGTPKLNLGNWATSFSSAAYDFAYGLTVNPEYYDDYNSYYIMDEADFLNQ